MSDESAYFYGINGTRGGYLVPPIELQPPAPPAPPPPVQDQPVTRPEATSPVTEPMASTTSSGRRFRSFDPNDPRLKPAPRLKRFRGWIFGVEPEDLASAGWAVIFAHDVDPAVVEALGPLLRLRESQAARLRKTRYKCCQGALARWPEETARAFLARHKAGLGPADPDQFPYYVLLVGGPERIPFAFQYELDSQYAVGRVCFDTPAEYAAYAQAVVDAEQRRRAQARVPVAVFATEHLDDRATSASARHLAQDVARDLTTSQLPCDVQTYRGPAATKTTALRLLGGDLKPALLFTATHGMAFEHADPRHLDHQGALLCQDPAAPMLAPGRSDPSTYVCADDLGTGADVSGLIAFFFGCYTAGTPAAGGVLRERIDAPLQAPREFPARLPQRLLARGALAVIGHVDQAWSLSFLVSPNVPATTAFRSTLRQLVSGHRVGHALESFGQRLGQAATDLHGAQARAQGQAAVADTLQTYEDARNYVLLGDPAVRLPPAPRRTRSWEPPDAR